MTADKLGARVQKFREERELSIEELAQASGVGVDMIKALEEENLYPSLAPLQKIARAMNIRLGTFMDDVDVNDPLVVKKSVQGTDLAMQKGKDKKAAFIYHSLGKGKADRNMEPFYIEISPEPEEDRCFSSHQGEEFIVVVKGQILLRYGQKEMVLEAGDSAYYNSSVPHYVGACGDGPAEIYAVVYYP